MKKDMSLEIEIDEIRKEAKANGVLSIVYAIMFICTSLVTIFSITQLNLVGVLIMIWFNLIMLILSSSSTNYVGVLKNRLLLLKGLKK